MKLSGNSILMDRKKPENYQIEDFVTDESFINYHFRLNSDDQDFWEQWLNEHPGNSALVEAAKEMIQTLSLTLSDKEYEDELIKMKKAIHYGKPTSKNEPPAIVRSLNWKKSPRSLKDKLKRGIKFFVPVLLILFTGGYFLFQYFTKQEIKLAEKYNHSNVPVVFTLSDSTVVTLAPQSSLHYSLKFGNEARKVYLEGEAQFHVKRDIAHPFMVYSGEVVATVLGTIFNIKQEPGDSIVQVELLKGKLKVETVDAAGMPLQSILLNPDERVVYNRHGKKLNKETWQPDKEQATPTNHPEATPINHLEFHGDSFETIAKQLKTVFGITVVNQSNKKDWRFTGTFNNSTAKDIVENICIVKKLDYQVQGDTIFIK